MQRDGGPFTCASTPTHLNPPPAGPARGNSASIHATFLGGGGHASPEGGNLDNEGDLP
jgi:hypothetical protein